MPEAVVVDLAGDLDWSDFDIPGGNMPARIVTLHVERPSRARSLLVEFPEGFRRDATGWYEAAEELVVLEGGLEMTGESYWANDWAWIPAGTPRRATAARPSMLAVARFDGPARWVAGERGARDEGALHETLGDHHRVLRSGPLHVSEWRVGPPKGTPREGTAAFDTELLAMKTLRWAWVPAGSRIPPLEGPCFCRTFSGGG